MTSLKLSNVSSRYGAPMGRRTYRTDPEAPIKFRLQRVYLDSGGYDSGGAYWGFGRPLYQYTGHSAEGTDAEELAEGYLRADSREDAKAQVRALYPKARFYA
jgi:hypothetical protein